MGGKVSRTIGAIQRGIIFWHPAIIAASGVPEMMMGVDLHVRSSVGVLNSTIS